MSVPNMPPEDGSRPARATLGALASTGSGWLRGLLLVGLTAGLMSAFEAGPAAGRPDPVLPLTLPDTTPRDATLPGPSSLQGSALTLQLDALTPANSASLEWRDPDDHGQVSCVALTRAEERALEEEANFCTAKLQTAREAEAARSAPVLEELESTVISLDFDAVPMDQALAFLRDTTQLNYVVSPKARTLITEEDLTVSLRLKDISLNNALKLILSSHDDLGFRVRDGVILIQTTGELPQLELAAFAVEDLVSGQLQGQGGASISSEVLVELIEESIDLHSTVEYAAGPGASRRGALVVRAPTSDLAEVRKCLRRLRTLERKPAPEPNWITHYREALASRRVSLDFKGSLADALSFLQDWLGLSLTLATGVDVDLPLELRLSEVSLEEALRWVLEQVGLVRSFACETLVVHEAGDQRYAGYEIEVLDVRDLLSWLTPDSLECFVEEGIEESLRIEWDPRESLRLHRGQLILCQTRARTLQIRQVVAQLRASHAESLRAARAR